MLMRRPPSVLTTSTRSPNAMPQAAIPHIHAFAVFLENCEQPGCRISNQILYDHSELFGAAHRRFSRWINDERVEWMPRRRLTDPD
ncbi:hypothetical protein ACWDKQ_17170 [Saccharopolyspora sp. NPDC000995]